MGRMYAEKWVDVDASAKEIWDQVVDVASWPSWKPFITKASVGGGYESLGNGTTIKFSILPGGPAAVPLSAKITEFNSPHKLSWTGGVPGVVHAVHSFEFTEIGGKTRVTSKEEFTGALIWFLKLMISEDDLNKLHEQWVQAIKRRVEKQPAEEPVAPAHH
jgi:hypothetical protein